MNSSVSLHEYRLACPSSAHLPTITQRGLIGPMLLRRHRRATRSAERRAAQERILDGVGRALAWVWRKLAGPAKEMRAHRGHGVRNLKPAAAYVDR